MPLAGSVSLEPWAVYIYIYVKDSKKVFIVKVFIVFSYSSSLDIFTA